MSYFGVDVSEHNGNIDWNELSKHIDFAILRVGWVGNKNNHTLDKKFEENYKKAKAAGVKLGAYVYMYSNSEATAKAGAKWTVERLKGKSFELPIYCDMEDKSIAHLGRQKLTAITKAFNQVIEETGYWAGIYASRNWFDNYLENGIEKRFTSWIAHYTSGSNKYEDEFDMWQNSSNGQIKGISGRVDTNYLYEELFSKINGDDVNSKGEYNVAKVYKNGSTPENVYADTELKNKIGTLDKYEQCECLDKINGRFLIKYKVNGTGTYKTGFVKYHGGLE